MPYSIRGNCVYKGETQLKCYDTHEEALAYFRALKANVEDSIHQFSMLISKSSIYDGEMRWAAVNSDTDWDLYGERMSLELYKSMIAKIKAKSPPPEPFAEMVTSDYWKGGMPYLSIAHYPDGNGKAVPGTVKELFIDGTQLKAKGNLHNSPLGLAVWKSLKEDEVNYKSNVDTDRIRISIAFLDLAHKHGDGGKVFHRKSFTDVCPQCQKGVGEKIYLDGYLVHLALTRVPVNPRTIMEAEDVMTKKSKIETRKDDALSVLGGDVNLVETVEGANALEAKSDVLVEMSETEEPVVEESVVPEKSEPVVEETPQEEVLSVTKSQLESLVGSLVEQAMSKKDMKKDDMEDESNDDESYHNKDKMKQKSEAEAPVTKSALEVSIDTLYNTVNSVVVENSTIEDKLQKVQPVLEAVGASILEVVKSSASNVAPAQPDMNTAILEEIRALSGKFESLSTEVATMKAQTIVPAQTNRVPVPRSITPQITTRSDVTPEQVKPGSVKDIVRRSVGLQ